MKINTKKIKEEKERLGLTYDNIGQRMRPKLNRKAVWYLVHNAKTFASLKKIARAMKMNEWDLMR